MSYRLITRTTALAVFLAVAPVARADVPPPPAPSDPVGLIVIGVVVLGVLVLLIRGALGLSARDKSADEEEEAGVGVLEGIDEDDDERRKRK